MTERVQIYPDAVFDITSRNVDVTEVVFYEKNVTYNQLSGDRNSIITGRSEVSAAEFRTPDDSYPPVASIDGTDVNVFTVLVEKVVTVAGHTEHPDSAEMDSNYLYTVTSDGPRGADIHIEDLLIDEIDSRVVSVLLSYTALVPSFHSVMVQ